MNRVGVLISGRGSNLQALINASRAGKLGGEIAVVASNEPTALGLEKAQGAGIPSIVLDHRGRTREDYETALVIALKQYGVGLVCLAGFMRRLSPTFVRAFPGRILNVHPSLLPAFPGLDAQQQAFDHGVKVAGATIHLVDEGLDTGPIVAQEAVAVLPGETCEDLAARILEVEHRIYPLAVQMLLRGRYRVEGRRVIEETA